MSKKEKAAPNPRLGQVGGQAVLEGVMMRHKTKYATAVRMPDGTIHIKEGEFVPSRQKHKFCNIPIIRGVINFVEMFMLSYRVLADSTESLGIDDMEPSKFEKWIDRHFGKKLMDVVVVFSSILGIALALSLFVFLPSFLTKLLDGWTGGTLGSWKTLIEGGVKILLFIGYLLIVSLMPDIRRTFEYHGAEHKSVFAYEAGVELTPENAREFKRFHPRCGTSFIFVILILGILVATLLPWTNAGLRAALKILVMPVIVGLGFEFIMFAGKHPNNVLVKILSAPGLWMQRITTKEPDETQLEIAICALKSAMPDEFPEFVNPNPSKPKETEDAEKPADTEEPAEPATDTPSASDDTPSADTPSASASPRPRAARAPKIAVPDNQSETPQE